MILSTSRKRCHQANSSIFGRKVGSKRDQNQINPSHSQTAKMFPLKRLSKNSWPESENGHALHSEFFAKNCVSVKHTETRKHWNTVFCLDQIFVFLFIINTVKFSKKLCFNQTQSNTVKHKHTETQWKHSGNTVETQWKHSGNTVKHSWNIVFLQKNHCALSKFWQKSQESKDLKS